MSDARVRDRQLLFELSSGDGDAFWRIWLCHVPHLRAVCYRHMRPVRADADDAVSRSMMVAREKLPGYAKEIVDLEAWLTRLTSNVCLDIKKERCRATRRVDSLDDNALAHSNRTLLRPQTPEESCFASQVRESIGRALSELSPGLSAVAQLRFVQEASYEAIAERLSITQTAARKRVQKARKALRQNLATVLSLSVPRG